MVGPEMLVAAAVNQVARKINDVVGVAQGEVKLCCGFSDDLETIKDTLVYLEGLLKNAENNSFGSERANLRHWLGQIKLLAYDIEDIVDGYYTSKEEFEGSSYAQKTNVQELSIISIVGPVGLGKTSLAQLVYNDARAEKFSIQSIKKAVHDILNKQRCLVVIDSLWGKDEEVNELRQMLLTGNCSIIFSKRAMASESDPLFREYGEEIVRRCEGIPLVANFLGSVVNAQRQRREIWQTAKDKEMWKIEEDYPEDRISPIFRSFKIIYYNMPHELRLCFVYCSIFPKGSIIDKQKLIQQWIALDMIESRHGTLPLDVTAEKYIDELKAIHFLQTAEEICKGTEEMLCMDNLAHDLARSVAGEDILVILDAENERGTRNYDYRYAQVSASSLHSIDSKAWPSKARSLIFKTSGAELQRVSEVLSVNKYLRVLDLSGCSIAEIPSPVFQLKQLRYLDASTLSITAMPPQVNGFHKLQTLDLSETELTELPPFIRNLKMLTYLNLQGCKKLQQLNNLDLLHELHYLNLSCCPQVRSFPSSLENLTKLRLLNLAQCSKLSKLPDVLLQSFSNFSSIVDLNLSGFEFQMLPDFFGSICSLQFLNLSKCSKLEVLPQSFGQLSYLKGLNLSFCSDLKLLQSFECLTSLEFLNLSNCPRLEYLPSSFEKLISLEYLNLSQCFGLKSLPSTLPSLRKLQRLEVSGCQDCVLQSSSWSSRCSQPYQCLEQTEEVASDSSISDITPDEPAISDMTAVGSGEASVLDIDESDYLQNTVKQKLNSARKIVRLIPHSHQFPLSSSHFSSFASSSTAPLVYASSSDVSAIDHPVSNGETAGLSSKEKSHNPHASAENGRSCENQAFSSHIPAHLHETVATMRNNDNQMANYVENTTSLSNTMGQNQGTFIQQTN
ncbi:hypothetical protein PR202_gb22824 [Eleusine coracana subsp. coracana]|uniref:Uncharacterized protein n=1 Tax=Eleusine coracana subsp. coracana TaxID=191504 RepID=A0AAV5FI89_ELECO|nr:hypothetical protein PR202_gb22824 [Eleusine coracana subsp. coracana]